MKEAKNLKNFYLVTLGLQLSCLNLSHKSRECLLLTVRVPDLKAIKPTPVSNSQNQQEMDMEQQLETWRNPGRSGSRVMKGLQQLLRAWQTVYGPQVLGGTFQLWQSQASEDLGPRFPEHESATNSYPPTKITHSREGVMPPRNPAIIRKGNSRRVQTPQTSTTHKRKD